MGEAAVDQRSPEQIRRDIDETRSELSGTIEQIEDRVSPGRIADRSQARLRSRWERARTAVMGAPDQGREQLSQQADRAGDRLESSYRGNPLAAGLIAFGAGALAASLLPSSRTEQSLAGQLRERAEPVQEQAKQAAQDVGQQLGQEAKQAAQETAETAKGAAKATAEEAKGAARSTGEEAKGAAGRTGEQAQQSAQQAKESAQGQQDGAPRTQPSGAAPTETGTTAPTTPPPTSPPGRTVTAPTTEGGSAGTPGTAPGLGHRPETRPETRPGE